jgi:diguanylate cyclase (GGDEF)-like protein
MSLNGIAIVKMKRGDLAGALPVFGEAMAHLERSGDREKLASVTSNVSLVHYAKGEYDRALDLMLKALGLYESVGDEKGQGIVLNALGNVYRKLGDGEKARERFERALAIAERSRHTALTIGALVNLAEIEAGEKRWTEALALNRRALALAREAGSRDSVAVCLNNIGDALRESGDLEGALSHYRESMRLFEEMKARPRLVVSYLSLGQLSVRTGRDAEAESYLRKAFDLAGQVAETGLRKDAAGELAELYERRGDYRNAYRYRGEWDALKDQVFSRENLAKVGALEARIDAERKGRQIDLLKKQGEIRELKVRRQRLAVVSAVGAAVLLAAIAFLLWRRYRLKERTSAALAAAYARVEEMARTDSLTGLANRRAATERLEQETRRSERTGRPVGLVLVDADDFKKVNDTRGHDCGDALLVALAGLLRTTLRQLDLAARWGGEEFLLILPETGLEGALVIAEKLRAAAAALSVPCGGAEVRFTITLGVAVFAPGGPPAAECLRRADEALYRGKGEGKDRVVAAGPASSDGATVSGDRR